MQKPRQIAVRVLGDAEAGTAYTEELVQQAFPHLAPIDRRFLQEIVYGVVRWKLTIDRIISARTQGRTQNQVIQNILRIAVYQYFWMDRVPAHALVHEAVELAKQLGLGPKAGFVNAVLRGLQRDRELTRAEIQRWQAIDPATGFSHPLWLWERWSNRWGRDHALSLLAWNNSPANTYARLNRLKATPEQLLAAWETEGVKAIPFTRDWIPDGDAYEITSHPALETLPSFQQGLFYIQDPSTLLAVAELDPRPGEVVLDLCSAPGGKTAHIGQRMANQGKIIAQDRFGERLDRVRENCLRLGVTITECSRADDIIFPELNVHVDRVLVDAPCSNTGVLRRRVDLRWRISPHELARLCREQTALLDKVVPIIKPGGRLVYSTCSLEPEENRAIVDAFLSRFPGFTLVHDRSLLPFQEGVDGAYVAVLTAPK